ncbi:dihydroxyacetone kinase subunit L [Mycobacterium yunnanensis]|uniref:Dihydroxyacetone kinase subunit L n=1 Tax=Mycobacterium yunnanensis TaxID=368477 RepID=A0A9X2Z716_9MYCO|nr:dihydroxyacetone kinase subunit DhaL [Mycobacterium yunnanensis]MCV7424315.1 dihydroxyacetone kinase subunit L [Mycobacterium yunnanensis]
MSANGSAATELERAVVTGFADAVEKAYDVLTRLDQHSGDGDFGDNLRGGVRIAVERTSTAAGPDAESPLTVLGSVFLDEVGGTSGPLLGLLFTEAAVAVADDPGSAGRWATGLAAGLAAVTRVGEAQVGDRTMVDALAPAVETLTRTEDFVAAADAAADGARRTADLRARMGRASYLGERAKGEPDPGAMGAALFLWVVARVVTGSTPTPPLDCGLDQ